MTDPQAQLRRQLVAETLIRKGFNDLADLFPGGHDIEPAALLAEAVDEIRRLRAALKADPRKIPAP